jgi:hypothetical protein
MAKITAPPLSRADAALQAGREMLEQFGDPPELREAIREAVETAEDDELREAIRRERSRERGQFWREQLPEDLVEAMLTPAEDKPDEPYWREALPELAEAMAAPPPNERWSANEIATMAAEIGVDPDRIDIPSIAKERTAAMAYVTPTHLIRHTSQLHRDLGIHPDKPVPVDRIEAATKEPADAGKRARLALRLIAMARSARR